ncbi:LLM class flavin-dependent oxidoreductase [Actinocorallia sp. A-T 12471]|uniref:LLM class flavin-dependent oxidoreductase n=1 Tax=Actinocorallia sp. A-T 12471 TaxID=3089813 RepID=UPI0029D239EA|nr:LLM class flavin-dependent oxidoreductase [Actinocorallia sp. A-T 12471]MDX6742315.1 LLM class flavin-dependent oxidoreductase [Actinocorallia sp. A-T 12471]
MTLHFNAFVMNTASHIQHGQWRHPDSGQVDFEDVGFWIDLAKRLEAGRFDAIFFADVSGLYGPGDGDYEVYARHGLQIPSNDPAVLLSALAVNTEHLGLAYTSGILQMPPFTFARQISTLDHISKGRIAWNIVTGTQENGARNLGLPGLIPHDERYRRAEEYVDVAYQLWEGSWDDGALLKDRERGIYADASKIHKIRHKGEYYSVEGPHLPSPSAQRTPLLFQAGASDAGRAFAARHAEAVFIAAPSPEVAAEGIADTRRLAVEAGRLASDIKFFQGISFVVGSTEEEARRKEADLEEYISAEGLLAHMNFGTRPDGTVYPPETPLAAVETEASKGILEWLRRSITDREPVVADLAAILAKRARIVGTPEQIADGLQVWKDAGVDGINVVNWRLPSSYQEFIDHVMPVLRKRGLAKEEYAEGSLRRKLFGADLVNDRHPAARHRGAFKEAR